MADIGISDADIIGEVDRFNSSDDMLVVDQQVSSTQTNEVSYILRNVKFLSSSCSLYLRKVQSFTL